MKQRYWPPQKNKIWASPPPHILRHTCMVTSHPHISGCTLNFCVTVYIFFILEVPALFPETPDFICCGNTETQESSVKKVFTHYFSSSTKATMVTVIQKSAQCITDKPQLFFSLKQQQQQQKHILSRWAVIYLLQFVNGYTFMKQYSLKNCYCFLFDDLVFWVDAIQLSK